MRTASFPAVALACLASGLLLTAGCQREDVQPNEDVTTAEDRSEDNLETAFSADLMTAAQPQDATTDMPARRGRRVGTAPHLRHLRHPHLQRLNVDSHPHQSGALMSNPYPIFSTGPSPI